VSVATPGPELAHEHSPPPTPLTSTSPPPATPAPSGDLTLVKTAIAALAGLLLSAGVLLARSLAGSNPPRGSAEAPLLVDRAPAAALPVAPLAASPGTSDALANTDATSPDDRTLAPRASASARPSESAIADPRPAIAPIPTKRVPPASRGPAASTAKSTADPNCTPNYTIDEKGKHFKPECFLKPAPRASP
jgi:hypothetical protein